MYKKVVSIVISFHVLFIAFLLFTPQRIPIKRTNHVKVRMVRPVTAVRTPPAKKIAAPAAPTASAAPAPATAVPQKKPSQPTQKPKPAAKKPVAAAKTSNKPAVIEKGKPIKKAPPKKKEPPAEIWNEIDQALAKIEQKSYPVPKQSLNLPTLQEEEASDDSVVSQLMGFLHDTLHLPEVGEVKMEITVRKDGSIAKVVVLRAESQKNKLYLQEHLPKIQLPMQFDQEKTWILTFCNEI